MAFIFILLAIALVIGLELPKPLHNGQTPKNTCINNLRLIDAAIQQWALENNKTNSYDAPTWADLKKYIERSALPKCPLGGAYKLGSVYDKPTCSCPGHELP